MKIKNFLLLFALLSFSAIISYTQQIYMGTLPLDFQKGLEKLLETRYPPDILDVKIIPETPEADSPVVIEATVFNNSEVTDDETYEVKAFYSTDDGNIWDSVELEQMEDNPKLWRGEIPGQPAGSEVLYFLRAVDSSGNITTELPCMVSEWPLGEDYLTATDCKNAEDKKSCMENLLPNKCMFTMSQDDAPLDDEENLIPNDFDFWSNRVGYDDETLYINLGVEGKVSEGTVSPLDVHAYVVGIFNPEEGKLVGSIENLLAQGNVLFYVPLATASGGMFKPCVIVSTEGDRYRLTQNNKDITCLADGNNLFFKVKRQGLNSKLANQLVLIAGDASITSMNWDEGTAYDYTHFTKVIFNARRYKVE